MFSDKVSQVLAIAKTGRLPAFFDALDDIRRTDGEELAYRVAHEVLNQYPEVAAQIASEAARYQTGDKAHLYAQAMDDLATAILATGLPVEDHLRVTDVGYFITNTAVQALAGTPFANGLGWGDDTLDGKGFARSGGFTHPLTDVDVTDPLNPRMNAWAKASVFITWAHHWVEVDYVQELRQELQRLVQLTDPSVDFDVLFMRSRYDDRALMQLCSLAKEAIEKESP